MTQRRVTSLDEDDGADSRLDDTLVGLSTRSVLEDDSQEFIPGSKVGRYVVLEQIGRGGMGVVLGAFDPQLNRKIALKLLLTRRHREGSLSSGAGRQRLLREAQAIAKLSHPNVISVYDVGTMGERIYVAMEFVEGCTLTIWLEQQKRSPEEIVDVFLQAGRGLAAAHAAGLVHRDFKPDNVLVGSDGLVRVSDFGLARADPSQVAEAEPLDDDDGDADTTVSSDDAAEIPLGEPAAVQYTVDLDDSDVLSSPLTQAGVVVGTPRYMAPEQHAGANADARSDQFAFCVALYLALYRQDPFVAHTLQRLAIAKQEGRVCEVPPQSRVPAYLEDIVMRGLAPEPSQRFPSMEDLVAELERDPAAWRHRLLLGVIGAVVAGSVALGVGMQPDEVESACRPQAQEDWAGIWDADRQESVRSLLLNAAPERGPVAWNALVRELDAFTGQWTQMRTAACETIRGRREPSVIELQLRCLQREQAAVSSLLDVLSEVDENTAPRAARILSAMPELEYCDSREYLLSLPMPPRDGNATTSVARLQAQIDRVSPMIELGRVDDALALAKATVDDAEALDYAPLRSEANYVYGRGLVAAGQVWDAELVLTQSVWLAARSQHDACAAAGARMLVNVAGIQLRRHREGVLWEELARSYLGRVGLEGLEVAALDNVAGRLALQMKDIARSRTYIERAIAVREAVRGDRDQEVARWWVDLGDAALVAGNLDEAKGLYERAEVFVSEVHDLEHPTLGYATWGLGRIELERDAFAESERTLTHALELLRKTLAESDPDVVRCRLDVARAAMGVGHRDEARRHVTAVLELQDGVLEHPHALAVEATLLLAELDVAEARWSDAERRLAEARALLRVVAKVSPRLLASLHRSEGELRLGREDVDGALASMTEALGVLAEDPSEDRRRIALARFDVARLRWLHGDIDLAERELEDARGALLAEGPRGKASLARLDDWRAKLEEPQ